MGFGCSGWGSGGYSVVWLIFKAAVFVLVVYVASYIFWAAKKQVEMQCKKKK